MKELASNDSSLSYRRIRAPKDHGQVLQLPDPSTWDDLWQANCKIELNRSAFPAQLPADFVADCRSEILQAAVQFTHQYRDVDFTGRDSNRIIMAGHQPTLFHAGVWYKNFVLADLAQKFNCYAINLIVDNDVCTSAGIYLPSPDQNNSSLHHSILKYDSAGPVVPFEMRSIQERSLFNGFGSEVEAEISPYVENPLVRRLWPHVIECSDDDNLGMAIAKGRHRLEQEIGLQTLELPVSALASTKAFASFSREILGRLPEFCRIYNEVAEHYRATHKIRNAARPVPNLKQIDDWFETPFWIWKPEDPTRRSLYAKLTSGSIVISNQVDFERTISCAATLDDFMDSFSNQISIRPKALITTLFGRLLGSDMFIHGIGGSKYDQLTDELCLRFFETQLPAYLTVSGTFLIQTDVPRVELHRITELKNRLRELKFHPENFVENPGVVAQQLIAEKEHWIRQDLPFGERLERHQAIEQCNKSLQRFVDDVADAVNREISRLQSAWSDSKVLHSREYSFCLHDEGLLESFGGKS